ncbi:hypothetical protein [Helicobacter aurati]|uniref:hypothetical protein n=1 Tax=Helicobacter aurati TaxID=137778 RepID=UPI0011C05704|nr:hypothetical protein [Helicobacter aurati]
MCKIHYAFYLRLDSLYNAHGEWVGNFIQWSKIMLLIVPQKRAKFKDISSHDKDSLSDSYRIQTTKKESKTPMMFDDEFLQENKQ